MKWILEIKKITGSTLYFWNKKRHPREYSWMSVNVDSIVLINVLRQLTLSDCTNLVWKYKKNTSKGALCKYSNSLELTFTKLWCFTSFLKTWFFLHHDIYGKLSLKSSNFKRWILNLYIYNPFENREVIKGLSHFSFRSLCSWEIRNTVS